MATTNTFFKRHSVAVNATTNIVLILLCAISYVLLLVLYFKQGMEVESFTYVGKGILPPTTAIPLLGFLLTGATSALLTRSVEHNLWTNLIRGRPESTRSSTETNPTNERNGLYRLSPDYCTCSAADRGHYVSAVCFSLVQPF
jgi:hypothetical protein